MTDSFRSIAVPVAATPTTGVLPWSTPQVRGRRIATAAVVALVSIHIPLALLMRSSPVAASIHGMSTLAVGVWLALRNRPHHAVVCVGYIATCEVLWRMNNAPLPWEFGKYASAAICLVALARVRRRIRLPAGPVLYFVALLPSIMVVLGDDALEAREIVQMLSFNLSGPFALSVAVIFAANLRLERLDIDRILVAIIAPAFGVATLTAIATYGGQDVVFGTESNVATSAGFGPNQVSAVLSLGALAAVVFSIAGPRRHGTVLVGMALALALAAQSGMTFSRGGTYSLTVALVAAIPSFLKSNRVRGRLLFVLGCSGIAAVGLLFPYLNRLTDGALGARFADTEPTHRQDIIAEDVRLWLENPVLGLGPGRARAARDVVSNIAHTEYTRMLSEHGTFGAVSLMAFALMAATAWWQRGDRTTQGTRRSLMVWGLVFMAAAGMRIAAFGLAFALAHISVVDDDRPVDRAPADP